MELQTEQKIQNTEQVQNADPKKIEEQTQDNNDSIENREPKKNEEQTQDNNDSTENIINNYFIDNHGAMLFLIEEDELLLKGKIKDFDCIFIEPTSEDLFQYISTEKTALVAILKDFYPSTNNNKENTKIINIIKQLLYYGQSIICISGEEEREYCKKNFNIFNK